MNRPCRLTVAGALAIVLLGGLITSTLLTLVLVPTSYTYLDELSRLPAFARAQVPRWLRLRRYIRFPQPRQLG